MLLFWKARGRLKNYSVIITLLTLRQLNFPNFPNFICSFNQKLLLPVQSKHSIP